MLDEASSILDRDRRDRRPQRLDQRLAGARLRLAQKALYLRERLLDGVVVRRVGWQEEQLAAPRLDQLAHLLALVRREVVRNYDLPGAKRGRQNPLDVSLKDLLRGASDHRQARPYPLARHARQERRVLAAVARHRPTRPLPAPRPGSEGRQRGVRTHFVYEDQALGVDSRSRRRPAPARPPSATRRVHSLPPSFFSAPSQALAHPADGRL